MHMLGFVLSTQIHCNSGFVPLNMRIAWRAASLQPCHLHGRGDEGDQVKEDVCGPQRPGRMLQPHLLEANKNSLQNHLRITSRMTTPYIGSIANSWTGLHSRAYWFCLTMPQQQGKYWTFLFCRKGNWGSKRFHHGSKVHEAQARSHETTSLALCPSVWDWRWWRGGGGAG